MTDRHGSILMKIGEFGDFVPDVVNKPGNKIRVKGRTVCHIYAKYDNVAKEKFEVVNKLLNTYIETLEDYCGKSYLASEQAVYIDETLPLQPLSQINPWENNFYYSVQLSLQMLFSFRSLLSPSLSLLFYFY